MPTQLRREQLKDGIINNSKQSFGIPVSSTDVVILSTLDNAIATKQNTLVSGNNIKTINNTSIVGAGNVAVDTIYNNNGTIATARTVTQNANNLTFTGLGRLIKNNGAFDVNKNLSGTIASTGTAVTGTGTAFLTELAVGDDILAGNDRRTITAITSNTALTVNSAFATNLAASTPYNTTVAQFLGGRVVVSSGSGSISKKANLSFASTFGTSADISVRRCADIVSGFNTGQAWTGEYLAFHVGNNGVANDNFSLTHEKIRILSNGNVGIGTSVPTARLGLTRGTNGEVGPNVTASAPIAVLQRTGTSGTKWGLSSSFDLGTFATGINAQTQLDIRLGNGASDTPDTTIMSLRSNGNVGIGTTAPQTKFHVVGGGFFGDGTDVANDGILQIVRPSDQPDTKHHLSFVRQASLVAGIGFMDNSNVFYITGNSNINTPTQGIFLSGANIGLNVSAPTLNLTLNGNATQTIGLSARTTNGNGNELNIKAGDQVGGLDAGGGFLRLSTGSSSGTGIADMIFSTSQGGSPVERLRIKGTGNVGVGTSNPTCILDINDDKVRVRTAKTITASNATGEPGEISWDANYIYVCVATNTWKRTGLSTW